MNYLKYSAIALFTLLSHMALSQKDTSFWFAAPEVSSSEGDSPIYLRFMSYDDPANIVVSQPANAGFTPISVSLGANSIDSINLTAFLADIESPGADVPGSNGLKIVSTSEISAFYEVNAASNKEQFTLKGASGLGDNFYTPFPTFWDQSVTTPSSTSSIDIVATENNTTILITPRTDIVGHAANMSFSFVLNEGETYSARDVDLLGSTSLAGSIVASNKPVAVTVFSGAITEGACQSIIGDQITSEMFTGRDFVVHRGTSDNDRVYILATQNATSITVTNSTTTNTLINWGETYEIALSDVDNYIQASKPVYVMHVSGYGCNLSEAQVPNFFCAGTNSTAFTRTTSDSLGLALFVRTGFENQFEINGNPSLIDPSEFSIVPGSSGELSMALIYLSTTDVPVNSYNEVTNEGDIFGLGVLQGDGSTGSSYGYLSQFTSYPSIAVGNDTSICENVDLAITGLVGGGSVTGVWSTNGFGSFVSGNDVLVNSYDASPLDTLVSPIEIILSSTGPCPVVRDTFLLTVNSAPIVSASADQTLCENNANVQLAGEVTGGATTGIWSTLGSGSFSPNASTLDATYVPSAADLTAGSTQLVLTSTNSTSCLSETDTMEVMFTTGPTVDAGSDTLYSCENNADVQLMGSVTGNTTTGKWTSTGSGSFQPNNLDMNAVYVPSIADINSGMTTLYLESTSNGDCLVGIDSVLLLYTAAPTVEAGLNLTVCRNSTEIQLNGSIAGVTTTGSWSGGAGTFTADNTDLTGTYTPTASELASGTLFLTLTSTNNQTCNAENDVVQISFVDAPFANFSVDENCLNEGNTFTDFSLSGFGSITDWSWSFGDATTGTNQNPSHVYSSPGTYDVQLLVTSDAGCVDSVTQVVEVFEHPTAGFSYTTECPSNNLIVHFSDESTSNDVINFWQYNFGGTGNSGQQNPSHIFLTTGDFTITQIVGTENGCRDTLTEVLSVPDYPIAEFSYNSSGQLNLAAEVNFVNTSSNATAYTWNFGDASSTSTEEDPSHTYFENGDYEVVLYAEGDLGCVDSTSQIISIEIVVEDINILIPNAISPNGDGRNDVWKLDFIELSHPDAKINIYNEWGQLLFESSGYETPWDGTFNGELVPDGTYYYTIDLNDQQQEIFKGTVLVLKSRN